MFLKSFEEDQLVLDVDSRHSIEIQYILTEVEDWKYLEIIRDIQGKIDRYLVNLWEMGLDSVGKFLRVEYLNPSYVVVQFEDYSTLEMQQFEDNVLIVLSNPGLGIQRQISISHDLMSGVSRETI